MQSLFQLSLVASLLSGAIAAIPSVPGYKIQWSDDFNQGRAGEQADLSQWNYESNFAEHTNNELQIYQSSAAYAGLTTDGALSITTRKSSAGDWYSARIATWPTFTCKQGGKMYIEAEIQVGQAPKENQQGIWPAFWALGSAIYKDKDHAWPKCGEWDIMELINGEDHNVATIHYGVDGNHKSKPDGDHSVQFDRSKFNKWGLQISRENGDWTQQTIKWYLNGNEYQTVKGSDVGNSADWESLAHSPYYLVLNIAVGGDYPGKPNDKTKSGDSTGMLVNYVAVYESI
jgi:beta-glucanase (GH16 family)